MTIKLLLLKSGEDLISDVTEMCVGSDEDRRVVGYFLKNPCLVRMRDPNSLTEDPDAKVQRTGFHVALFPWMPLSADQTIPIATDWVVTMVEPVAKLKEMYIKDVKTNGKDNQTPSSDEQPSSDQ